MPPKLFAEYEANQAKPSINSEDMRGLIAGGDSPEMAAMVSRLVAAGLEPDLAIIAARQMMGLSPGRDEKRANALTPDAQGNYATAHSRASNVRNFRPGATLENGALGIPVQTKEQEWAAYEKEHPIRANTKKLLTHAVQGAGSALAAPVHTPDAEKISAHRMLKEYLAAQDMQRAGESEKEALWMLARMPGQALAGQPIYGGPTTPTDRNAMFAAQDNANYALGKR